VRQSLSAFIADIESNNIKHNEVIICTIDKLVVSYLEEIGTSITSTDIILTVRRYKHILRDIKKYRGGAITKEIVLDFDKYLSTPQSVYFDSYEKHKNIMYINEIDNQLFKIIVNLETNIITAGKIDKSNLKDKFLVRIK
jgi:hypothetical protein